MIFWMLQWWQQLVALACEHNRRMGDTMGSNRGNRHEHSDGQQQGQDDGEHGREESKREHDGELSTALDGDCGGGGRTGGVAVDGDRRCERIGC